MFLKLLLKPKLNAFTQLLMLVGCASQYKIVSIPLHSQLGLWDLESGAPLSGSGHSFGRKQVWRIPIFRARHFVCIITFMKMCLTRSSCSLARTMACSIASELTPADLSISIGHNMQTPKLQSVLRNNWFSRNYSTARSRSDSRLLSWCLHAVLLIRCLATDCHGL